MWKDIHIKNDLRNALNISYTDYIYLDHTYKTQNNIQLTNNGYCDFSARKTASVLGMSKGCVQGIEKRMKERGFLEKSVCGTMRKTTDEWNQYFDVSGKEKDTEKWSKEDKKSILEKHSNRTKKVHDCTKKVHDCTKKVHDTIYNKNKENKKENKYQPTEHEIVINQDLEKFTEYKYEALNKYGWIQNVINHVQSKSKKLITENDVYKKFEKFAIVQRDECKIRWFDFKDFVKHYKNWLALEVKHEDIRVINLSKLWNVQLSDEYKTKYEAYLSWVENNFKGIHKKHYLTASQYENLQNDVEVPRRKFWMTRRELKEHFEKCHIEWNTKGYLKKDYKDVFDYTIKGIKDLANAG